MTEDSGTPAPLGLTAADVPRTAGALLRQARQAKGLHIAALAASLKVPQRKLEALEADRHEELLDATFARALAQTMCRSLKVDPAPVLALLPHAVDPALDRVAQGLNQPFRERPGREEPQSWAWLKRPGPLAAIGLLVAAAAVYLAPGSLWSGLGQGEGVTAPSAAASEPVFPPATASSGVSLGEPAIELQPAPPAATPTPVGTVAQGGGASAPVSAAVSTPTAAPATGNGPLRLSARAQTWVEVRDANDQMLANRTLESGEQLVLDGALPFKIKIGNAAGAEVQFRGQPVDLGTRAVNNVARFELK
ncbi:MAG: helix-turn-helix domain-containing protein [Burkholderiaceae bacterium]|nr:helix-turn-helix domain-containing protein [Burkholderiaceae bacterium]